jgi:nickel superoxide dismutase
MSFFTSAFGLLNRILPAEEGHAHCDIPCGIYDPHAAQIAALTAVRMNQLIDAMEEGAAAASLSRYIAEKERHAELCKHELRILWGDYFKPEHLEAYPDLHDNVHKAMKAASAVKQSNSLQAAEDLLAATQNIAEIFWKSKGAEVSRQPSRQIVGGELVYPA